MQLAHVAPLADGTFREHPLDAHLREVADLAAVFAEPFNAQDFARLAGMWHDLGKYRPAFQAYLKRVSGYQPDAHIEGGRGRITHSTAGALLSTQRFGVPGRVLAYLIAGHHAGLSNWVGGLRERLAGADAQAEFAEALSAGPSADIVDARAAIDLRGVPGGSEGFALWLRLLFSCLVDADFLDTERFMDPRQASVRGDYPGLPALLAVFDAFMDAKQAGAAPTLVNRARADVLRQCREKAALPPGLFSLTVPTGGGKTLASLSFALRHAVRNKQRRVVYAIPYTSIIEQTTDVFRQALAGLSRDPVLEHHSQAETAPEQESLRSRLACENWDAPLVVTTNVQLFESLFAARTSRCRKLHNLVGSVIVLDEAQQLPAEFLQPILDVLNLLVRHYGVTVVLCTATQPALSSTDYFDPRQNLRGLDAVTEIVDDPAELYSRLKRVQVQLPADLSAPSAWPELAQTLSAEDAVLAIVDRRRHARELHALMPPGTVHLSALMCGAHRAATLRSIRDGLAERRTGRSTEPLRVISTQLVEAGVDLDFPRVYRALAGLDSIAQAAGRCNREGLAQRGYVIVFVPPEPPPPGLLRKGEQATRSVLHGWIGDPLDLRLIEHYFRQLYAAVPLDARGIVDLLWPDRDLAVAFRTAAENFRLIDDGDDASVIVRYASGPDDKAADDLIRVLDGQGPERWLMRKLQRYTVTIRLRDALRLAVTGGLREVMPGLFVQVADTLYDPVLGLLVDDPPPSPERLVL